MSRDESGVGTLEEEREITQLLLRYCECLDTGEIERLATDVYASDAVADYNFHVSEGSRAIVNFLAGNMARFKATAHLLSNVSVKACDGKHAEVTAVITAWQWVTASNDVGVERDFAVVVSTWDRLERTPDGWRITEHRTRGLGSAIAFDSGPPSSIALGTPTKTPLS